MTSEFSGPRGRWSHPRPTRVPERDPTDPRAARGCVVISLPSGRVSAGRATDYTSTSGQCAQEVRSFPFLGRQLGEDHRLIHFRERTRLAHGPPPPLPFHSTPTTRLASSCGAVPASSS